MNLKLVKDLLYTKDNQALDIARSSTAASLLLYWGGVFAALLTKGAFSPAEVGAGCAAIFAAGCAWIHFRQKQEPGATADAA